MTRAAIPDVVYMLWGVTAILGYVLLPVAVYWLHSLWRASSSIRRYARDGVVAAEGIQRNVAALPALDGTVEVATEVLAAAESVAATLETMAVALEARGRH